MQLSAYIGANKYHNNIPYWHQTRGGISLKLQVTKQMMQQCVDSDCHTENVAELTVSVAEADIAGAADCCWTEHVDTGGMQTVDEALAIEVELRDAARPAAVPDTV